MSRPVRGLAEVIVLALVVAGCATQPTPSPLNAVAGHATYEWNQPFLAWPDTGDAPCETEDGPCGTPYPTLDPETRAKGTPLRIDALSVPVGGVGHHELVIGHLAFAEGVHSSTSFRIVNGDVDVYRVAGTRVEFRSLVAGAPPFTDVAWDRPRVAGVEPVEAVLVWDVDFAVKGAVMEIRELVVE